MRLLILTLIAGIFFPIHAESVALVGILGRNDFHGNFSKSIEAVYRVRGFGMTAQFESADSWTFGARAYFAKHFFLQEAVRRNRITDANMKPRQALHPWIIQTGAGVDYTLGKMRFISSLSPAVRLKTVQVGYVFAAGTYMDIGHNVIFRAQFVRGGVLNKSNQVGIGFDYRFKFR